MIWYVADVSSVSPSSEQTKGLWGKNRQTERERAIYRDRDDREIDRFRDRFRDRQTDR